MSEKKYILKAFYTTCNGVRTLADLVVTNPKRGHGGIWATSQTSYGGNTRHFYSDYDVVSICKK